MHIRYEDSTSCPGTFFAVGATFKRFSTTSSPVSGSATAAGSGTPVAGIQSRTATLMDAAVYWDTAVGDAAPERFLFSSLSPAELKSAFLDGIVASLGKSVVLSKPTGPAHTFIAEPSTSVLNLTTNSDLRPGYPKLKASVELSALRFGLNHEQYRCAMYLQHWLALHQFRPTQSPKDAPRHWWHYAVKCVTGHRSDGSHRQARRWDFDRVQGVGIRRTRYIELYKYRLRVEAAAAGEDAGTTDKALPASVARELDLLEVKHLTFEQALLFRFIAEVWEYFACSSHWSWSTHCCYVFSSPD